MATKALTKYRTRYVTAPRRRRKASNMTLPIAAIAGFAPLAMGEIGAVKRALAGDTAGAAQQATIYATGYNLDTRRFHWPTFMMSYGPILAGFVVHKAATRFGLNRALAQAGVPIFRI
jgi:hypothetical protein